MSEQHSHPCSLVPEELLSARNRVRKALALWRQTFNCRRLYLGGGNARLISIRLPVDVRVTSNVAGLLGGIRLWNEPDPALSR